MEVIIVETGGILDLHFTCYYTYNPAVPEDDINPPDAASVELERVSLRLHQLWEHTHLSTEEWKTLEQHILEQHESNI
jgi:hypothetical protein